MSERISSVSNDQKSCLKILTESLKIFLRNKHIYSSIFLFLALPLSLLHFSLCSSSYPIKSQILHLEFLASLAPTRFEARQVWKESREIALHLLHLKLFYFLPTYILSLIASITIVAATESAYNRRSTTLISALAALGPTWKRPLVTSICVYAVLLLYASVPQTVAAVIAGSTPRLRFAIWVVGLGVELYIVAVTGVGLVVSVVEKRFGWDAIWVGSGLMEGRRVCGWVLSGLLAGVTGGIGWRMEGLKIDGGDLEKAVLVGIYGVVLVWGYVVTTIFYCECRKRHVVRGEEEEQEQELVDS